MCHTPRTEASKAYTVRRSCSLQLLYCTYRALYRQLLITTLDTKQKQKKYMRNHRRKTEPTITPTNTAKKAHATSSNARAGVGNKMSGGCRTLPQYINYIRVAFFYIRVSVHDGRRREGTSVAKQQPPCLSLGVKFDTMAKCCRSCPFSFRCTC